MKRSPSVGLRGVDFDLAALIGLRFAAATLELGSGLRARELRSGQHRSRLRGRGIDYAETRIYTPGDDIRAMDWRVTARTGVAHSKLFREERERPLLLVVDLGATMRFGTRRAFKSVVAAEAAALVAWAALGRGDRVAALAFSGASQYESRPGGGRRGVLHALRVLASCAAERTTAQSDPQAPAQALARALTRARAALRPGSMLVIISDFYGLDAAAESRLTQLGARADLACIHVYDPLECEPPPRARYTVTDGARRALLDMYDGGARARYAEQFSARRNRLQHACRTHATPLVSLRCGDPVLNTLRRVRLSGPRGS